MAKASRRIMFSAVALSVGAFTLGSPGIVSEQKGIFRTLTSEGAPTVSARALVTAPKVMPLGLPDAKMAKAVLSESLLHHHPQWIDVPMGDSMIRTFVLYPDLAGNLPVAVVTDQNQAMSDWARAVGTQLVNEGFITVVPDPGGEDVERRTRTVRDYFASQPGSNGDSAVISFNWSEERIDTAISTATQNRVVRFDATEHAWHNTLALLTNMAPPAAASQGEVVGAPRPKDEAALTASAARQRAAQEEIASETTSHPAILMGPGKLPINRRAMADGSTFPRLSRPAL